jgi:beta-galactosidase
LLLARIEATCRSKDGKKFMFLLNHTEIKIELGDKKLRDLLTEQTFSSSVVLAGRGVVIVE